LIDEKPKGGRVVIFTECSRLQCMWHGGCSKVWGHLMFVDFCSNDIPFIDSVDGYVGQGMYAVVRCLDGEPTPLKDSSVLLLPGQRHDKLTLVCTEHFHEPICILNIIGCPKKSVFVVPPHSDWAEEFC
jgi:hypothetical protein